MASPLRSLAAAIALSVALPAAAAAAKSPYSATPGAEQAHAAFSVAYKGAGKFHTKFHGEPHNPGGADDKNDAHDSSTQSWDLRYQGGIDVPTCGQAPEGDADPCSTLSGPARASGVTLLTGRVNHKHVDGLYRQLDRTVKCSLRKRIGKRQDLEAAIGVRYLPESDSIAITAYNPLSSSLNEFPNQCPKQGDSIDRILDFYATPGFSFDPVHSPDRWLTSRETVIPAAVFHRSAKIAIPLADTPAGTPPRRCAVPNPKFEHCRAGGSWSGVLTLKRRPAPAASARATAARTKFKVPRSGKWTGSARKKPVTLYVNGKSLDLMSFAFACGKVEGSTALNSIPVKKTKKGYRFSQKGRASIGYSDEQAPENATVQVSGRFSKTGRRAKGVLRVKSKRCHDTGEIDWSAHL